MACDSGAITPEERSQLLSSPVAFSSGHNSAKFLMGPESDRSERNSVPSAVPSDSTPRIDSCILGRETLEEREKFTVSICGCYCKFGIFLLRMEL